MENIDILKNIQHCLVTCSGLWVTDKPELIKDQKTKEDLLYRVDFSEEIRQIEELLK